MQIYPIQTTNYYQQRNNAPSFGETAARSVTKAAQELFTHYTVFNRGDFKISDLVIYTEALLRQNNGKVNFVFCGCSDGTEALDVTMGFLNKLRKDKLMPSSIKAFDKEDKVINVAKTGRINVCDKSIEYIRDSYPRNGFVVSEHELVNIPGENLQAFKEKTGQELKHSYQFSKELLDQIHFYQADMLTELAKISPDDYTILFCRNLARYNTDSDQREMARLMDKNLRPYSLVIVGDCDAHNTLRANNTKIPILNDNEYLNLKPVLMVEEMIKRGFIPVYDFSRSGTVFVK